MGAQRLVVVVDGRIQRVDMPALFRRLHCSLLGRGDRTVICDVARVVDADARTVGALARLAMAARRLGARVQLRDASPELVDLLRLMGVAGVIPLCRPDDPAEPSDPSG